MRGFSDAIGSWKTIIRSRRTSRSALPVSREMSWPMNSTDPSVGSSSRTMQRASVDLPQPDSPTMPSVSPWRTSNDTPSTALTLPISFWKMMPRRTGKCFLTSVTFRIASLIRCPAPDGPAHQLRAVHVARGLVQMARDEVRAVRQRLELRRRLVPAALHHVRAARVERGSPPAG